MVGSLLVPIVLSRLPEDIKLNIIRTYDAEEDVWELDKLLDVFNTEVKARERCETVTSSSRQSTDYDNYPPTAATLKTYGEKVDSCLFCKGAHKPAFCRIVSNPNARKAILLKERRCFLCLSDKHRVSDCKSTTNCNLCNGTHHASIHEEPQKTGR